MAFPTQYNDSGLTEFDRLEMEIRGQPITLRCELPNGNVELISVTTGQDVAYAKSLLAKKLDIAYNSLQFYLGTSLMIDPLSFNDFPEILKHSADLISIKVAINTNHVLIESWQYFSAVGAHVLVLADAAFAQVDVMHTPVLNHLPLR